MRAGGLKARSRIGIELLATIQAKAIARAGARRVNQPRKKACGFGLKCKAAAAFNHDFDGAAARRPDAKVNAA